LETQEDRLIITNQEIRRLSIEWKIEERRQEQEEKEKQIEL
jgi:hypothetical protein